VIKPPSHHFDAGFNARRRFEVNILSSAGLCARHSEPRMCARTHSTKVFLLSCFARAAPVEFLSVHRGCSPTPRPAPPRPDSSVTDHSVAPRPARRDAAQGASKSTHACPPVSRFSVNVFNTHDTRHTTRAEHVLREPALRYVRNSQRGAWAGGGGVPPRACAFSSSRADLMATVFARAPGPAAAGLCHSRQLY
jgi:hypothetical protein